MKRVSTMKVITNFLVDPEILLWCFWVSIVKKLIDPQPMFLFYVLYNVFLYLEAFKGYSKPYLMQASCDFIYNRVETVCKSKDSDMRSRCLPSLPSSPLTIWEGAGSAHANYNCKRRISTLQKLDQITEKTWVELKVSWFAASWLNFI